MRIYALIMAGGMAKRMDGADKGLVLWHGKSLIDRAVDRIKPQVGYIAVNANHNLEECTKRTLHVFSDSRQWQGLGPLVALCTAANDLQLATADWLLIVPCDMPKLSADLVEQFVVVAKRTPLCNVFYAETSGHQQYSVMFIRPQVLQSAMPYLYTGQRILRGWLQQQRARSVAFGSEENLANYNTPQDLEQPL